MQVSAYCLLIKLIYVIFKLMDVIHKIYPMPLCGMILGLTFAIRQMMKRMRMRCSPQEALLERSSNKSHSNADSRRRFCSFRAIRVGSYQKVVILVYGNGESCVAACDFLCIIILTYCIFFSFLSLVIIMCLYQTN